MSTKTVVIEGDSVKRSIIYTFAISFSNEVLPIQLIYGRKTEQSIPCFKFPEHKEREKHSLYSTHNGLPIFDLFTGQMKCNVHTALSKYNIFVVNVPQNMDRYYQPLDLTVNGHAKTFMKNKFSNWYAKQIAK